MHPEAPRAVRLLVQLMQALVVLSVVGYGISLVARGPGHPSLLLDGWLAHVGIGGGALLCLLRAALVRADRFAWLALGAGLSSWTAGNVYWWIALRDLEEAPYPSLADAG